MPGEPSNEAAIEVVRGRMGPEQPDATRRSSPATGSRSSPSRTRQARRTCSSSGGARARSARKRRGYQVQKEGLKTYFNQALWLPTGLTFIGENAAGAHVRVSYFLGAEAPDPPAPAQPRA